MWRMRAFLILASLLALELLSVGSVLQKGDNSKLSQITAVAEKAPRNVIGLDDETYAHFAIKPQYSLIVFLTAAHPKFKCSICKALNEEYELLATAYRKKVKQEGKEPRVFFLRLDYEASMNVFQKYEIQSVPVIFHIPSAGESSGGGSGGGGKGSGDYQILIRDRFAIQNEVQAEAMASFLKDRTGVTVTIERSQIWVYVLLLVLFGVIAALVRPVLNSLDFFLGLVRYKPLWALVSLGVYTCAISGLIFDIIRLPQLYYTNPQSGAIMWFYPQSGSQFVVEGFIIGFLNLGCAASLIFLTIKAPTFKTENGRMVAVGVSVLLFALFFNQVRSFYVMKNRWYGSSM